MPLRLLLALILLSAGCGEAGPSEDAAVADGTDVTGDPPPFEEGLYDGTCLAPVVDCFDLAPPCQMMSGERGFTNVYTNGAAEEVDFTAGTTTYTSSDGTLCWTETVDVSTLTIFYETSSGRFQETEQGDVRQITCPDGTTQTIPNALRPFIMSCTPG